MVTIGDPQTFLIKKESKVVTIGEPPPLLIKGE